MSSNQQSGFANKVKFALIGTLVLGGGSLALILSQNLMNKNQTQNNPQLNVNNNSTSQGGKGGDLTINNPLLPNGSPNNQQPESSSTTSSQSNGGQNPSNNTPKINGSTNNISNPSSATPIIDVESTNIKWSLKYPVYKIQNDKCVLAGAAAVTLDQSSGGEFYRYELLNVYGYSRIRGTVTASGKVNISISSDDGNYLLTLDGENPQISANETVIAGKATMLNCQESTFELKK